MVAVGRTNPAFGSNNFETTNADSQYQGLQAVLTKRLSHGLQVQGAFTWGRVTDDVQGQFGPSDCQSAGGSSTVYAPNKAYTDKGPACFNVSDNLRISALYHLPTFKGDNVIERGILGGWWLGSLVSWQTGFPFTPIVNSWVSNSGHLSGSNANGTTDHASLNTTSFHWRTNNRGQQFIPYNKDSVITGMIQRIGTTR